MELETMILHMERNARRIQALAGDVSADQARWKPDAESWSILEVINHLYDEEREDFRRHLDQVLYHPGEDWAPIDPQGWVVARAYNQRDPLQSLRNFQSERQASLAWLRGLGQVDFRVSRPTPWRASLSAGDLLASWAGHDLLHLRQLVELERAYILSLSAPYSLDYAGDW